MDKFWMIIGKDSAETKIRHFDKEDAEKEIERLTRRENKAFYLLEAIEICEPAEVPVKWSKLREKGV